MSAYGGGAAPGYGGGYQGGNQGSGQQTRAQEIDYSGYQFDGAQYDPEFDGGLGGINDGDRIPVYIESHRWTSSEKGKRLSFVFVVQDGHQFAGQKQSVGFNLEHANADTARIAHQQLAAVLAVCGVTGIYPQQGGFTVLYNRPFLCDIGKQRNDNRYSEVKALYYMDGAKVGKDEAARRRNGGGQITQQQPHMLTHGGQQGGGQQGQWQQGPGPGPQQHQQPPAHMQGGPGPAPQQQYQQAPQGPGPGGPGGPGPGPAPQQSWQAPPQQQGPGPGQQYQPGPGGPAPQQQQPQPMPQGGSTWQQNNGNAPAPQNWSQQR